VREIGHSGTGDVEVWIDSLDDLEPAKPVREPRALNQDGVPTAHGGRQWWPSTVRAVLIRSTPPVPTDAS
jgi:hypothetical protein